jgi:putative ABC transport system permease protein
MFTDTRHAIRGLMRTPGFTAVAVLTLALGIGATTAIFAVVNRVVFNPLPFEDAGRLVVIWGSKPHEGLPEIPFSQPDFDDLRTRARTFDAIAGWGLGRGNVTGDEPEQVQFAVVTSNLFEVLRVAPSAGRAFTASEESPGTAPTAIVSSALSQRRFGGAPAAIGRTIVLDGRALTVVGVLPAGFSFLTFPNRTDVWLPFGADPSPGRRLARGARSMGVLARLAPETTLEQARAEADGIAAALAAEHPRFNTGRRFAVTPLTEQVTRGLWTGASILFGAVACVLLIACANVAGLVLARGTHRRQEMAIRSAIGASQLRLIRHQLAESFVLAITGAAAGLLLAAWIVDLIATLPVRTDSVFVPYSVPRAMLGLDPVAVAFSVATAALTAILFGLVPAIPISRTSAGETLRAGAPTTPGRQQRRARSVLVAAEIALSLVLLVAAAVMGRSFLALRTTDPGFRTDGVLSAHLTLSGNMYRDPARMSAFFADVLGRLGALPGVSGTGAVELLPLAGLDSSTGFYIEGRPAPARADEQQTHHRSVSAGYFPAMGITMVAGRPIAASDTADAPRVAVINETMARRFWPGEDPLGKRIALDLEAMRFFPDRPPILDIPSGMRTIVGIVRDIRHGSLVSAPAPEMYVPYLQRPVAAMTLVVRTEGDPAALAPAVREEIRRIDRNQPIARLETLASIVSASIAQPRANAVLIALFAGSALGLALVGVYALLAYVVAQRSRELGIRLALGARPSEVRALILKQGGWLVGWGLAIGTVAALALTALLRSFIDGIGPVDVPLLASAIVAVGAAAIAATYVPARRATKVDPISVLRST